MIKRPLDKRFADLVKTGQKKTTIWGKGWPLDRPIML